MKKVGILLLFLFCLSATAQMKFSNFKSKELTVTKDTIQVSDVSINPAKFKIIANGTVISQNLYQINFETATLVLDATKFDKITIEYTAYPEFLTSTFTSPNQHKIIPSKNGTGNIYNFNNSNRAKQKPFDGLYTQGSLARGITIGNNQDAVTNSSLDLQIAGKLSKDIGIKASISDSNIPIQKNGYSQQIEEFDRIYMELFTKNWNIQGGDINLYNQETKFLSFDKKVSGISIDVTPQNSQSKNHFKGSGALVRGRFTRTVFNGVEGNQGPYRLQGPNGETFFIILSGSETIYVNGRPLKRGDQNDYTIDYNTAEITFTTTFPIQAGMRITAEFQYSDRNYTRFVSYNKASHQGEKLEIGGYFYTESDAKNQPLQQNLSEEQKKILSEAGNDTSKMISESAYPDSFDENKIQYTKTNVDGLTIFVYSQNPADDLYNVTFSYIGENLGSYSIQNTTGIGRIFEYIGPNQGTHEPIIQLVAPTKTQVATAKINYKASAQTSIHTEVAVSDNDQNLFSTIDDENNRGMAAIGGWTQIFADNNWLVKTDVDFNYLQQNFKSVQRIFNVEFSRDWNLTNPIGTQEYLQSKILLSNKKNSDFSYGFESLAYRDSYRGNKHLFTGSINSKKTHFNAHGSYLKYTDQLNNGHFLRWYSKLEQHFNNKWIGINFDTEDNQQKNSNTEEFSNISQKFINYGAYFGIGDSTKVYAKLGINIRKNDSIKSNQLTPVNNANNYYLKSTLVKNQYAQIGAYINYRTVENFFEDNTSSLNSRISYTQRLFKNAVSWNTVYETGSGTSAQQQFAYIKTEPGQGYYTWIDYNGNGLQEFEEFEVAKFSDQADYLRVTLPTINYIRTNQTKLSHSLFINPIQWQNKVGIQKFVSQFSNQTYILIDKKQKRLGNEIHLNPFNTNHPDVLGLVQSLKNSFYFRRGLQKYATTYTYASNAAKNDLGIGIQDNRNSMHQLNFQHRINALWMIESKVNHQQTTSLSENYSNRNYKILSKEFIPNLTYFLSNYSNFSLNYEYKNKAAAANNTFLYLHKAGGAFQFTHPKKGAIMADFNFYKNNYIGALNTPVAYEILEGLQPGNNFVWNLLAQKKLTSYLHLNLNYSGRKSDTSIAIHTGSIQLRALF